ncbi:MAG TPA: DUF4215 domain-containing protein, partial [Polyangiaceae bacterium]|nr:DUF4215 domain-containing protein [Polyangiaceae bacterium]
MNHSLRTRLLLLALSLGTLVAGTTSCTESDVSVCEPTGRICPPGTACTVDGQACITGQCGNGARDEGEACDDGNVKDGDGCSENCRSDETCGNGVKDEVTGEVCDDNNEKGGDGCRADC